jgi:hypothetical protein
MKLSQKVVMLSSKQYQLKDRFIDIFKFDLRETLVENLASSHHSKATKAAKAEKSELPVLPYCLELPTYQTFIVFADPMTGGAKSLPPQNLVSLAQ